MKLFIFLLFFNLIVLAKTEILVSANAEVVNKVLFSVAGESSTSRDMQIYELVLSEQFQKNKMSRFVKNNNDDFLLSRLVFKEVQVLDLKKDKNILLTEVVKKKLNQFSDVEINNELSITAQALVLMELKENQFKVQERFDTWFELLKRKYQVKLKTNDFK